MRWKRNDAPVVQTEPEPQGSAVTVGYLAAEVPTLTGHRLKSDDAGVNGSTVRFLLQLSLALKMKEEERRRMVQESVEQVRARVDAEFAARHGSSSSTVKRTKRKMKLPRNFSRLRLAAQHLGRYGPEGHLCRDTVTTSVARAVLRRSMVIPQLQSIDKVVDVPDFADRAGSSGASVVETLVLPQLQIVETTIVILEGVGMPVGVLTSGCSSTG